jgi:hypothetical protein
LHFHEPIGHAIGVSNKIQTSRRLHVKDTFDHSFHNLPSELVIIFPIGKPIPGVRVRRRSTKPDSSLRIHHLLLRIQKRHDDGCCY